MITAPGLFTSTDSAVIASTDASSNVVIKLAGITHTVVRPRAANVVKVAKWLLQDGPTNL